MSDAGWERLTIPYRYKMGGRGSEGLRPDRTEGMSSTSTSSPCRIGKWRKHGMDRKDHIYKVKKNRYVKKADAGPNECTWEREI
jgi:hypothetical protein